MIPQSAVILAWAGDPPNLFAVTAVKKCNCEDRGAEVKAAEFIAPEKTDLPTAAQMIRNPDYNGLSSGRARGRGRPACTGLRCRG